MSDSQVDEVQSGNYVTLTSATLITASENATNTTASNYAYNQNYDHGLVYDLNQSLTPGSGQATIIINSSDWTVDSGNTSVDTGLVDTDPNSDVDPESNLTDDQRDLQLFLKEQFNQLAGYITSNDFVIPDQFSYTVSVITTTNVVYRSSKLPATTTYLVKLTVGQANLDLEGTIESIKSRVSDIMLGAALMLSAGLQIEE